MEKVMKPGTPATPAFHGSTVVSTRKSSGIEGAIVRRRLMPDGSRRTTYEIDESQAEKLLAMTGGLKRRHTAINPDNIAKAKALAEAGKPRKEAEGEMGVSSGTYRRLLQAAGVETRTYTPVLTEDNVLRALKVTVKYDIRNRGQIVRASKEMGTDSRTLRRLLQKGLTQFTPEQIAEIRATEQARLATPEGQQEMEMAKKPLTRKSKTPAAAKKTKAAKQAEKEAVPGGPEGEVQVTEATPPPVADAVNRGDDHSAETGLINSPLVPVTPHHVEVREKQGMPMVIEQASLIENAGTSLHEPHGDGEHVTARDRAANAITSQPPVPATLKPLEMVPPVQPVDQLDRTRPNIVPGGTTVEPIEAVSDVDEQKAKGIFAPTRDGVRVPVDPEISQGNSEQFTEDQNKMAERTDAQGPAFPGTGKSAE
jgi:hypothetical protein